MLAMALLSMGTNNSKGMGCAVGVYNAHPMRAFEVFLNGKRLCVAGVGKAGVLTTIIDQVSGHRDRDRLHLHVGGLNGANEFVTWWNQALRVNDVISLKIIETDAVDKPKTTRRRDPRKELRDQSVKWQRNSDGQSKPDPSCALHRYRIERFIGARGNGVSAYSFSPVASVAASSCC